MKVTGVLIVIAILLTSIVYVFEEKADVAKRSEIEKKSLLIDPTSLGELKSFRGKNFKINTLDKIFYTDSPRKKADNESVDAFFNEISGVKVKRILDENEVKGLSEAQIFNDDSDSFLEFEFQNKTIYFQLGKKLDFDQTFYLKVKEGNSEKIIIAEDSKPLDQVYMQEDAHRADGKYRKFKSMMDLPQFFFFDMRLFKREEYPKFDQIDSITIKSFRNKSYQILIQTNQTDPAPPPGIKIDEDQLNDSFQKLMGLKGQSYLSANLKELELKSEVVFKAGSEQFKIELYYDKKEKNYLCKTGDEEKFFLMEAGDVLPMFRPVQDYWNLYLPIKGNQIAKIIFPNVQVLLMFPENLQKYCIPDEKSNSRVIKQQNCTKLNRWLRSRPAYITHKSDLTKQITWDFSIELNSQVFSVGRLNGEGFVWDRVSDLLYNFSEALPMKDRDLLL